MFKVLHEFKQSAKDFDNECIYCKYSQYALRESYKVTTHSGPGSFVRPGDDPANAEPLIQNQDPKIDHLVKMFQS